MGGGVDRPRISHRLRPPTLTLPLKGGGNRRQIERKPLQGLFAHCWHPRQSCDNRHRKLRRVRTGRPLRPPYRAAGETHAGVSTHPFPSRGAAGAGGLRHCADTLDAAVPFSLDSTGLNRRTYPDAERVEKVATGRGASQGAGEMPVPAGRMKAISWSESLAFWSASWPVCSSVL